MKIGIKNLGAIENSTIDLKPLTVFIGENNSGKTWAAYTICSLFGSDSWISYKNRFSSGYLNEEYPPIESLIDELFELGTAKINIVQFFDEFGKFYYTNLSKLAPDWLKRTMGTDKKIFENVKITININNDFEKMKKYILSRKINRSYPRGVNKEGLINIKKERNDEIMYFYFSEDRSILDLPKDVIQEYIYACISQQREPD